MSGFKFPHPLVLLVAGLALAAAASWVLPTGQYERRDDPITGRRVVVAGTYHPVAASPLGPFRALVAIPKGMVDAASVIFFVFLIGGAFTVVDRTGALRSAVEWLVRRLERRDALVIPTACLVFALGGVLDNMKEEIIALVPVMLLLVRRLGFDPVTAVAASLGSAAVGAAFSPINPFQVGIAQQLAQLPLLSGAPFRVGFLLVALGIWIWGTMRYAVRTRAVQQAGARGAAAPPPPSARRGAVLVVVLATFACLVVGVLRHGWGFDQMAALFFAMGIVAGVVGGLGAGGTAAAFADGFTSMAYAALLIGFARAIYVALEEGHIVDTIVRGLFAPVAGLPLALSALGMMVLHAAVHVPVPSPSGHAVLTLPILVPLSDLLGLSRQVTVLAYQYGGGLCELLTPTNGALMAILAAAGVRYEHWLKFALPLYGLLLGLGAVAIALGIGVGLR
ncbi:MAG TPA: SLC13 family permease [Gemmatimonadales bacterium]|nr:SLC13 family permease [Gemmatimonadales bacterium]